MDTDELVKRIADEVLKRLDAAGAGGGSSRPSSGAGQPLESMQASMYPAPEELAAIRRELAQGREKPQEALPEAELIRRSLPVSRYPSPEEMREVHQEVERKRRPGEVPSEDLARRGVVPTRYPSEAEAEALRAEIAQQRHSRPVITERDVLAAAAEGKTTLTVPRGGQITHLAFDLAKRRGMKVVED